MRRCESVLPHVGDRSSFRPYLTGLALIAAAHRVAPEQFRWRSEPYEFVADPPAIDLLTGSDEARRAIEADADVRDLAAAYAPFERAFAQQRRPALLPDYV